MDAKTFEEKTEEFSSHISSILNDTLSGPVSKVDFDVNGPQASVIRATKALISNSCPGNQFGVLESDFSCCASSSGRYFAVEESHIRIKIGYGEKTRPVIRIDFNRDDNSYISCHAHVVGANSLFDYLTPRIGKNRSSNRQYLPQTTDVLHIPVGGKRFRPTIEDVIELLIRQCGVSHPDNALEIIQKSRDEWIRTQTRAAVTDNPEAAVEALKAIGYSVTKDERP